MQYRGTWSYSSEVDARPSGAWYGGISSRPIESGTTSCAICGAYEEVAVGGEADDLALCRDCLERGSPATWELYYERS
jgi:hypothetical protein